MMLLSPRSRWLMTGRASFHLLESDKGWEGGDKVPEDRKAQGGMDSWGR